MRRVPASRAFIGTVRPAKPIVLTGDIRTNWVNANFSAVLASSPLPLRLQRELFAKR